MSNCMSVHIVLGSLYMILCVLSNVYELQQELCFFGAQGPRHSIHLILLHFFGCKDCKDCKDCEPNEMHEIQ